MGNLALYLLSGVKLRRLLKLMLGLNPSLGLNPRLHLGNVGLAEDLLERLALGLGLGLGCWHRSWVCTGI